MGLGMLGETGCGSARGRWYDRREKIEKRLEVINSVALGFFRLRRDEVTDLASSVMRRRVKPVEYLDNPSKTIAVIRLRLSEFGAYKDTNIIMYVSAQQSKKRPYQAEAIARKLAKIGKSLPGDKVYIVYVEGGATIGAFKILKQTIGAYIARDKNELKKALAKYFKKRFWGLLVAVSNNGGRAYGPVAVLMSILAKILKSLGLEIPPEVFDELYLAAKKEEPADANWLTFILGPLLSDVGPPASPSQPS